MGEIMTRYCTYCNHLFNNEELKNIIDNPTAIHTCPDCGMQIGTPNEISQLLKDKICE
jgi:NAD-dependent SIR2 family protein deacetylase